MLGTLIFGGTFNPVHLGHVRAAAAVCDILGFDQVDWIPSFAPLHKANQPLLPFDLRLALLRAALSNDKRFSVNPIEQDLPTPSVTVQTLEALERNQPSTERHFLLGDREFLRLHHWRAGTRVVEKAHIVVACRTDFDLEAFSEQAMSAWPRSRRIPAPLGALISFELLPGRQAVVVKIPRLDISSSLVRHEWLSGRDVSQLVPETTIALLTDHHTAVRAAWAAAANSTLQAS